MTGFPITGGHILDIEVAPDICLVGIRSPQGKCQQWEVSSEWDDDIASLKSMLAGKMIVTFNELHFDFPLLCNIINDEMTDPAEIYAQASILLGHDQSAQYRYQKKHCRIQGVDHIDVMPLSGFKVTGGLKALGLRMERRQIETFEFTHGEPIGVDDYDRLRGYNVADLELTADLYERHSDTLKARQILSVRYASDLRSKSDSQLGETILTSEYQSRTGVEYKALKQSCPGATTVPKYRPSWLDAITHPALLSWYDAVPDFIPTADASKVLSQSLFIHDRYYKVGAGGLHSVDGEGAWDMSRSDGKAIMVELDVASFYPSLMLREGIVPRHMDKSATLGALSDLTQRRLQKKKDGDIHEAAALKIAVNALYGKTNSKYSALFDPYAQLAVSVAGQLALLQLIVMVGDAGARVVSANTDGVVVVLPKANWNLINQVKSDWEELTKLTLERTDYQGLYQLDGNNYFALCMNGDIKTKGRLRNSNDLGHNPFPWAISEAVIRNVTDGDSVAHTMKRLRDAGDIRPFLLSTTLNLSQGEYAQQGRVRYSKVLRWYRSHDSDDLVKVGLDGSTHQVSGGESAQVCMTLPDAIPVDLDVDYYIEQATAMLLKITRLKRLGGNRRVEKYVNLGLTPIPTWGGNKSLSGSKKATMPAWASVDYTSHSGFAVGTGEKYGILCIDIDHPDVLQNACNKLPDLWGLLFKQPTLMIQAIPAAQSAIDTPSIKQLQSRAKLLFKMESAFTPAKNEQLTRLFGFELFYKHSVACWGGPRDDGKVYVTNEVAPAAIPEALEEWLRDHCSGKPRPKRKQSSDQMGLLSFDIDERLPTFAESCGSLPGMSFKPDLLDGKGALVGPCPGHHRNPGNRDLLVTVGDDGGLVLKCLHSSCDFTAEIGRQLRDAWWNARSVG